MPIANMLAKGGGDSMLRHASPTDSSGICYVRNYNGASGLSGLVLGALLRLLLHFLWISLCCVSSLACDVH